MPAPSSARPRHYQDHLSIFSNTLLIPLSSQRLDVIATSPSSTLRRHHRYSLVINKTPSLSPRLPRPRQNSLVVAQTSSPSPKLPRCHPDSLAVANTPSLSPRLPHCHQVSFAVANTRSLLPKLHCCHQHFLTATATSPCPTNPSFVTLPASSPFTFTPSRCCAHKDITLRSSIIAAFEV